MLSKDIESDGEASTAGLEMQKVWQPTTAFQAGLEGSPAGSVSRQSQDSYGLDASLPPQDRSQD